jgi:hypothetical protein
MIDKNSSSFLATLISLAKLDNLYKTNMIFST